MVVVRVILALFVVTVSMETDLSGNLIRMYDSNQRPWSKATKNVIFSFVTRVSINLVSF